MGPPCDAATLPNDPLFRERATSIASRHLEATTESVAELADLGLVKNAEIRVHRPAPLFKLYFINPYMPRARQIALNPQRVADRG